MYMQDKNQTKDHNCSIQSCSVYYASGSDFYIIFFFSVKPQNHTFVHYAFYLRTFSDLCIPCDRRGKLPTPETVRTQGINKGL